MVKGGRWAGENRTLWLLAGGYVLVAALSLPGHLSYDSIMQLNEGRRGFYANWHPPMMSWLLGIFDDIWPGTALFVLFDLALLFGSLTLLVRLHARPSTEATAVLALCILTPQFLLYQGIVWKDVLFADLAIAGFAALALAAARWADVRARWTGLLAALILLSIATLVRQNGGVVLPAAAIAVGFLALRNATGRPLLSAFVYSLGALALSAMVVVSIHSGLALRIPGDPSPTLQFRLLQFYDLIGAVKTEPGISLPFLDDDDPELEALMRSDGVRLYTPERNDTLAQSDRLQKAYFASPDETIPEEWHGLIYHNTGLYLRIRAEVFRWVFMTPNLSACRPVFSGISGPAPQMARLGLKPRFDQRDAVLGWYAAQFSGTPLLSHVFFALLALLFAVVLVLRRRSADIVMASLLFSTLAFTASFFVISIACDYRYLYFLDLSVLVSGFYLALDWHSARTRVLPLISRFRDRRAARDH